ncbi:MAG: VWA domain-containing protein [Desulfobacterales bacterium]|nr:VWA domain-containing protein [Desulfobacterales bacterium]
MANRIMTTITLITLLFLVSGAAAVDAGVAGAKKGVKKPRIEAAFVLDATGSMGGLIAGAKLKIWSIANEMVSAKPTPDLKLGLVGYRDRGDQYVTRVHDLSDDLDAVYENLQAFNAAGGGDTPESVNQALYEAVTRLGWSGDRDVLKIIFLVGDAPPHMDYDNDVRYPEICKMAVKKDLIINTIQCGAIRETSPIWREIARLAEGRFVRIGQTGNMTAIETPMDEELDRLNRELAGTTIAYGRDETRHEVAAKMAAAESAPRAAKADRLSYLSKSKKVVTGKGDLVADMEDGEVNVGGLAPEELPDELKNLDAKERKAYVEKKAKRRKEIQARIDETLKKRDAYIKAELSKKGKRDAFDEKVGEMIREQARKKGIVYDQK